MVRPSGLLLVLVGLLTCTGGCSSEAEPFVWPTPAAGPTTQPPPFIFLEEYVPEWPPLLRAARVYQSVDLSERTQIWSTPTAWRYVLYEDGSFTCQTTNLKGAFYESRGTYKDVGGAIALEFTGGSSAKPWLGTGTITEDSLEVTLNSAAGWDDVGRDGLFLRQREAR